MVVADMLKNKKDYLKHNTFIYFNANRFAFA